jgi:hypothetical protein
MKNWIACLCVILLTLQSCQKEESFEIKKDTGTGTNPGGTTTNSPFYYKATIGGTYYEAISKAEPTGQDDYWSGSGMGGQEEVSFSSDISPMTNPTPLGFTIMEITKDLLTNYYSATNATVKEFLAPGSYPYKSTSQHGISILWGDKEGKLWSTNYGSQDQTGSTFKIVSAEEYFGDPTVMYTLKVKMQFNCKLYKEDTGEMKELTNGEMVGLFARIK